MLLRDPLNPLVPALAQHSVSPLVSVIVTVVLLKVAFTCAIALVTFRRIFRRLFATDDEVLVDVFATVRLNPDNYKRRK